MRGYRELAIRQNPKATVKQVLVVRVWKGQTTGRHHHFAKREAWNLKATICGETSESFVCGNSGAPLVERATKVVLSFLHETGVGQMVMFPPDTGGRGGGWR